MANNSAARYAPGIANRRKTAQKEMAKRLVSQQSLVKLQQQLTDLTPQLGTQEGGYAFERWFYDLAIYFELEARPGYKADGRQIDGAITIEGTTFLLETKYTNEPIGSPDIDTFMAKIESKADNTMGLFVSMSGFNDGAKKAASKQRTPMLLLDHSHIFNLILRTFHLACTSYRSEKGINSPPKESLYNENCKYTYNHFCSWIDDF
jgi:hypothetical protein